MPFKSVAHREKFRELVKQGKITQAEFDKWQAETGEAKLPERVPKTAEERLKWSKRPY